MREFTPFTDDHELATIGAGLLDRTLPKARWTHAVHFAATLWLMRNRQGWDLSAKMPAIIRAYNLATGGENTDHAGYHETITQASLTAARLFAHAHPGLPLFELANALLASDYGDPDWLLTYWSNELLFSVTARRVFVPADVREFPPPAA
jgi:hypothetical protein